MKPEDINEKRMQDLYHMLIAISRGNFSCKIARTGCNDQLETLIMWFNMAAEELRETLGHYSYIHPRDSYRYLVQLCFVLDHRYRIRAYNTPVTDLLGYEENALHGRLFKELLAAESLQVWKTAKARIKQDDPYTTPLVFTAGRQFLVPAFCTFSELRDTRGHPSGILVTSTETVLQTDLPNRQEGIYDRDTIKNAQTPFRTTAVPYGTPDIHLLQEVYDYILGNLGEPLPTLRQLAHNFGTNEYKLKQEFKQVFQKTIFQCYHQERLRKARLLVEHSGMELPDIARKCGFRDYPNFSRAFKKKFGHSPKQLQKKRLPKDRKNGKSTPNRKYGGC
ncbi:AraC-type DNA-binding protein [Sinomicrobium oceani]|uniref:AraC-type DNA-binding protein n=1 Tax=Sinomicrobium oceani TaxID=1150368 RepID=A0A1K1M8W3_9FLAO|nr:helix-turn-helix domain-containing protein [Sinomicrobium oceani]SFW19573.1 AraC-type DNA-binding protein [Sinomicrobium oceani]